MALWQETEQLSHNQGLQTRQVLSGQTHRGVGIVPPLTGACGKARMERIGKGKAGGFVDRTCGAVGEGGPSSPFS